jgi:hypothetical protein
MEPLWTPTPQASPPTPNPPQSHYTPPSTLAIMTEEFSSAVAACEEILFTPAGAAGTPWQRLFEPFDFFGGFKNFLQVQRAAFPCARPHSYLVLPPANSHAALPTPLTPHPPTHPP